jgi:hypothetical protein
VSTAEITSQSILMRDARESQGAIRPEDRRRSQRLMLRVPVVIHAMLDGKALEMAAHTEGLNMHGAMLCAAQNFAPETRLEVEHKLTHQRTPARVTRQPEDSGEGYLIPVEFVCPSADFWHISFPSLDWQPLES